jgi:hypothetical protein
MTIPNININCFQCGFETDDFPSLLWHLSIAHSDTTTPSKCLQCDYKVTNRELYCQHIIEDHLPNIHICTYCEHETYEADSMEIHINNCHILSESNTIADFSCSNCQLNTSSQMFLDLHSKSCHKQDPLAFTDITTQSKIYTCYVCNYKTKVRLELTQHKKAIHPEKCYNCNKCSYAGTTERSLVAHIRNIHLKNPHVKKG